jgi:lysophospholipase L1-like esterase
MMQGYDADGTAKDPATCEHAHATHAGCVTNGRCTACLAIVEEAHGHKWKSGVCTVCGRRDLLHRGDGKTRVVCVGDSITAGGYWQNNLRGYLPVEDYEVIGLGVSGTTGLWTGVDLGFDPSGAPYSYVVKPQYEQSKRYNGDVVVIMLGTNDSKPVNYAKIKEDNGAQFIKDMTAMVQAYQSQANDPQVFLALPATVYRDLASGSINNVNLEELIIPCLEAVAEATGATLIDVHSATKNQSENFPDGVHPNDAGKAVIAQTIANAIKENAED